MFGTFQNIEICNFLIDFKGKIGNVSPAES